MHTSLRRKWQVFSTYELQPTIRGLKTCRALPTSSACSDELAVGRRYTVAHQVKVRDVLRIIEADGWRQVSQEGSHRQFKHPLKKGRVTVAGHPGVEMPAGTLKNIYRQAQIQEKK